MPKRSDIKSILILGAGPIVIGQACEFDYADVQACKALRQEGYRIILVNSNPATIMTESDLADATYIEPVHWEIVSRIIEKERPDALLPTMGGQTALNCALDLVRQGVLARNNVELIGATKSAIEKAEDRALFRQAMQNINLEVARSKIAHTMEEALAAQSEIGYPTIIRPSFTLGGSGGGIAYNHEEFVAICEQGLQLSPISELLIEESLLGWKEFEMEVVRDKKDNCIIVCSIENIDPMGIHTGDSNTVAPAQTLTDKEYQTMRNASIKVLREIGVDTGGSNVQFAVNPKTGRLIVIEMNPRVSRSSALASKATGFPIAFIAAKLAVGYTLDELRNGITGNLIPCSFEPSIDYVVTKIPRFNFDKFPQTENCLTTQMKSVGEVMAIGRSFQESLQKAMRSLETNHDGFISSYPEKISMTNDELAHLIRSGCQSPTPERLWIIGDAFRFGATLEEVHDASQIDNWFLAQIKDLIDTENQLNDLSKLSKNELWQLKRKGFSDARLATLLKCTALDIRHRRQELQIYPVYKRIDTCAAEFPTATAYLYSTYENVCEAKPSNRKKIAILGGGPNRIGQGIEFDYCCVHAALALKEDGFETIMINCNPETVSTDYDISDRLYFEPVTVEDVLNILEKEKVDGVIVQFGGQTPLTIAKELEQAGVPIIGTKPDAIDCAENRQRFQQIVKQLKLNQPANDTLTQRCDATNKAAAIGYPLVVRPSYVLGGRAMEIVYNEQELLDYLDRKVPVSQESPVLLDRFLHDAIEVDVDAICDGQNILVCGIMEHIEQAGIHSGDSSCTLPPFSLSSVIQEELKLQVKQLATALNVVGLINTQFAIQGDDIFILEVNPRASRTVPFVSKAIGMPLAKIAARCMVGKSLQQQGFDREKVPAFYSIKMPVFPFAKFPGVDPILGPEMKSTGEVMGMAKRFGQAYAKAQLAAGIEIKKRRRAFVSVKDADKSSVAEIAKRLVELGFEVVATHGTAKVIEAASVPCVRVNKVKEGRPHIVDMIKNDEIDFIVNTIEGQQAIADSYTIRRALLQHRVSYTTTLAGAKAACLAMKYEDRTAVICLQDLN